MFCGTNVGLPPHFALLFRLKVEHLREHTGSSEHVPQPCCELSSQESLLCKAQELRLHSRVLLMGAEDEASPVPTRVQEWAAGNGCKR